MIEILKLKPIVGYRLTIVCRMQAMQRGLKLDINKKIELILRITKNLSREAKVTADTSSLGISREEFARFIKKAEENESLSLNNPDPMVVSKYRRMNEKAEERNMPTYRGRDARIIMNDHNIGFSEKWSIETPSYGGDDLRVKNSTLQHTRMRFDTMTKIQLFTRMGKVTIPEKILAFAIVAEERGEMALSIAAKARYAEITGDDSLLAASKAAPKPKPVFKKPGERMLRKLDG